MCSRRRIHGTLLRRPEHTCTGDDTTPWLGSWLSPFSRAYNRAEELVWVQSFNARAEWLLPLTAAASACLKLRVMSRYFKCDTLPRRHLWDDNSGATAGVGVGRDRGAVISQLFLWHHSCTIYAPVITHSTVSERVSEWVRFIYLF